MGHPGLAPDIQLFRDVFDASPIGIAVENLEGQPLFVNPAFCSFLGFSAEELRTKHCVDFSPPEDASRDWALFKQLRAGLIDHYQLEKRYFRRDGSLVWGLLTISLLTRHPSPLVVAMIEDITRHKQTEEALSNANQRLIQAHEEERTRIARELHDDIGQRIALLTIRLGDLQHRESASVTELRSNFEEACGKLEELGRDVQALSRRLHSARLEHLGLEAAANAFCREFSGRQGLEIEFQAKDVPKQLPQEISLCLFRVLQEAVQNAAKHSRSNYVQVSIAGVADGIELTVRDTGIGFDPNEAVAKGGLGLTSMKERMKLVQGELFVESAPQCGTTIRAHVAHGLLAHSANAG